MGAASAIAFGGGGVAAGVFMLAWPAADLFGALFADQLTAAQAQTFYLFGDVFLLGTRVGSRRRRAPPCSRMRVWGRVLPAPAV